ELAELLRHRVADRVRDVDPRRALADRDLEHAAEEIRLRAARVLGRELDVRAGVLRVADRELGLLDHLLGGHAQLLLHVDRAGGEERVDAPRLCAFQRIDPALDVLVVGAAQARHGRVLDDVGDRPHRLEIAVRRGREACLDHVDAHALQRPGDAQLLVLGHGGAWGLLAVAHRGVEDDQVFGAHETLLVGMRKSLAAGWGGQGSCQIVGFSVCARGAAAGRPGGRAGTREGKFALQTWADYSPDPGNRPAPRRIRCYAGEAMGEVLPQQAKTADPAPPAAPSLETRVAELELLYRVGISLSAVQDKDRLVEMILLEAKQLCNADGGTLYLCNDADQLEFEILRNDTLRFAQGGTTGVPITLPPIPILVDGV